MVRKKCEHETTEQSASLQGQFRPLLSENTWQYKNIFGCHTQRGGGDWHLMNTLQHQQNCVQDGMIWSTVWTALSLRDCTTEQGARHGMGSPSDKQGLLLLQRLCPLPLGKPHGESRKVKSSDIGSKT